MRKITSALITIMIITILSLFGAGDLHASAHKLGVVLPLTGDFANTGENLLNAI